MHPFSITIIILIKNWRLIVAKLVCSSNGMFELRMYSHELSASFVVSFALNGGWYRKIRETNVMNLLLWFIRCIEWNIEHCKLLTFDFLIFEWSRKSCRSHELCDFDSDSLFIKHFLPQFSNQNKMTFLLRITHQSNILFQISI